MIDCAFQGDMELYRHWLEKNGEAVDWYISHFDNQNLDDYPLTFAAGDFPDFRDEWDKTSLSRSWNTSLNLPYLRASWRASSPASSSSPAWKSATAAPPASWSPTTRAR